MRPAALRARPWSAYIPRAERRRFGDPLGISQLITPGCRREMAASNRFAALSPAAARCLVLLPGVGGAQSLVRGDLAVLGREASCSCRSPVQVHFVLLVRIFSLGEQVRRFEHVCAQKSITSALKFHQVASGFSFQSDTATKDYEEDHVISPAVGRFPNGTSLDGTAWPIRAQFGCSAD